MCHIRRDIGHTLGLSASCQKFLHPLPITIAVFAGFAPLVAATNAIFAIGDLLAVTLCKQLQGVDGRSVEHIIARDAFTNWCRALDLTLQNLSADHVVKTRVL
jgi:hypothetical protein